MTRPPAHGERQRRCWLIDDEPMVTMALANVLRRAGFEVETFDSGEAARRALASRDALPDLVITDQGLPGMSGLELLRAVTAEHPKLATVLCTGNPGSVLGDLPGRAHCLVKPFEPAALLAEVQRVLAGKNDRSHSADDDDP